MTDSISLTSQTSPIIDDDTSSTRIALAEANTISEDIDANEPTLVAKANRKPRNNVQNNKIMLGIGDEAYELIDETGEQVYVEFLDFLNR